MAPESKTNKRKASAPASEAAVKKVKKISADTEGVKKRKAVNEIAAKPAKKSKAEVAAESSILKAKAKSVADKKPKSAVSATKGKTPKKLPPKKTTSTESDNEEGEQVHDEAAENSDDDDEEVDDQTAALLAGFDSDEEDLEPKDGEGFKEGEDVGQISKKAKKQALAAQKKASESDEPGTVYLGHIPHGFFEHEIKSYFSQFGEITRHRVSRNPKTGRSKHYAFIEFKSSEVAEIVAKTMDNYLLFGHILKCKLLAPGQAHADLWKGANKRFKAVPWNKIAGRKLNQGMDEAGWEKRNQNEEERRAEKAEKMKEIGYEFEAPTLKSAKEIPKTKREEPAAAIEAAIEAEAETAIKAIEAVTESVPVVAEEENSKRSKRSNKGKGEKVVETIQSLENIEFVEEAPEVESTNAKKKKSKKVEKSQVVEEIIIETPVAEEATAPSEPEKTKKPKKSKVIEKKLEEAVIEVIEKPTTSLKSKKSRMSLGVETKETEPEKPASILKSKKSKENVSESVPAGKAKKIKKQKSSSSLA